MQVIVLGAGVIGITTAYYLSRAGCDVTIVERNSHVSAETSYANGGQLSYIFTDSLAKPDFLLQLPRLLLGRDSGSMVRLDPSLFAWGMRFLLHCTRRQATLNTLALLAVSLRSAELMRELCAATGIEFAHRANGKLILLGSKAELESARRSRDLKQRAGCTTEILSWPEAVAVEPALAALADNHVAAVHSTGDHIGDARLFTERLSAYLVENGRAKLRLATPVSAIELCRNRFDSVVTDGGRISADAIVVCAGGHSSALLQPLGVRLPIYPVRGYSVTLPRGPDSPSISVTALSRRLLFSPLAGRMRIAGFADFVGGKHGADEQRTSQLHALARQVAPGAADYEASQRHSWAGNRPMTPNGRPYVGASPVDGIYLNAGHGMLGWTLANACAAEVAECLTH
jgi:D-amino-acid dehydrogenase